MRARNIKPGYFKNEDLADCDPLTRLLFAGLWCMADREGRLENRPKKIKVEILPYDNCNIPKMLDKLEEKGFIRHYSVNKCQYIEIKNFKEHQNPHIKEAPSTIPAPEFPGQAPEFPGQAPEFPGQAPDKQQPKPERAGLIPDSPILIPEDLNPAPPVDNSEPEYPPFDSIEPEKAVPSKKPKTEKPGNGKDHDTTELRSLVAQVKAKHPKLPIDTWYGSNMRAHPEAILNVLRSLLKAEHVEYELAYLNKALAVQHGKFNARDSEREHEERKKRIPGEMETLGKILARVGGGNG